MKKATILAVLFTIVMACSGCNTIEYMADGFHRDIKAYNDGNADTRKGK